MPEPRPGLLGLPRRMRLYLPGSGMLGFLLISAAIGGAAVYTQANLLYWAFGLMVGGLAVSALWMTATMRRLAVKRLVPTHGMVGEPLVLRLQVENRSWLPIFSLTAIELDAEFAEQARLRPRGWISFLPPRGRVTIELACWPTRRGSLTLDRLQLASSFPFGIVSSVHRYRSSVEVMIFPRVRPMEDSLIRRCAKQYLGTGRLTASVGGETEFMGLRPYRVGDPIRRIDWKHTARLGEPITRQFTHPQQPTVMMLLDLESQHGYTPSAAQWEQAISLAASVAWAAQQRGFRLGMAVTGATAPLHLPQVGRLRRDQILTTLAGLEPETLPSISRTAIRPSVILRAGDHDTPDARFPRAAVLASGNWAEPDRADAEVSSSFMDELAPQTAQHEHEPDEPDLDAQPARGGGG